MSDTSDESRTAAAQAHRWAAGLEAMAERIGPHLKAKRLTIFCWRSYNQTRHQPK
jgi:hypothetical protein